MIPIDVIGTRPTRERAEALCAAKREHAAAYTKSTGREFGYTFRVLEVFGEFAVVAEPTDLEATS